MYYICMYLIYLLISLAIIYVYKTKQFNRPKRSCELRIFVALYCSRSQSGRAMQTVRRLAVDYFMDYGNWLFFFYVIRKVHSQPITCVLMQLFWYAQKVLQQIFTLCTWLFLAERRLGGRLCPNERGSALEQTARTSIIIFHQKTLCL